MDDDFRERMMALCLIELDIIVPPKLIKDQEWTCPTCGKGTCFLLTFEHLGGNV
jgi:hypothetical protein